MVGVVVMVVVVDEVIDVVFVVVLVHVVAVDPRNLPFQFGQNQISNS